VHGADIGGETKDWELFIDRYFDVELRDRGFKVQWRKWSFHVNNGDVHVYIDYTPITFDDTFISRCSTHHPKTP
jgi:hypothetical protein